MARSAVITPLALSVSALVVALAIWSGLPGHALNGAGERASVARELRSQPDAARAVPVTPKAGSASSAAPVASPVPAPASNPELRLAERIVADWPAQQARSGLFRDPLTKGAAPGFGPTMLGASLMRIGRRRHDQRLLAAGVRASIPTARMNVGRRENPLTLLAVASTYNWAKQKLSVEPAIARGLPAWRAYLSAWKGAAVGAAAARCFQAKNCWHSYDLVNGLALLELARTGVAPAGGRPGARVAMRKQALALVGPRALQATGNQATLATASGVERLGVLSDQPDNPLAYHALSLAMLARALSLETSAESVQTRIAFERSIGAALALVGPDGDLTYMGRAQGQSWPLAAMAYAAEACAAQFAASKPELAGRCRSLANLETARLERLYSLDNVGIATVPRYAYSALDSRGLDRYAHYGSYNGMTALFLDWAGVARAAAPQVKPLPLPLASGNGAFVDPTHSQLAVLRQGPLWAAFRLRNGMFADYRYDFGLLSLKRLGADGRFRELISPRPLSSSGCNSAGPLLVRGAATGFPAIVQASWQNGRLTATGGFMDCTRRWIRRGVRFKLALTASGATLSWKAQAGDRFLVTDFSPRVTWSRSGALVRTRAACSRVSRAPVRWRRKQGFASAYARELTGLTRTLHAKRNSTLSWTISACRPGSPGGSARSRARG